VGPLMQAYKKAMLFDYTITQLHATGGRSAAQEHCTMKILVVDDHPLIRSALRYVLAELESAVELLDAADCATAMELADAHPDLDLILLDLALPDLRGLDALYRVRDRCPAVPVVVLSATEDQNVVRGALDAGALGFIPKSSSNQVMLSALRLVLSGGVYVPPQALHHEEVYALTLARRAATTDNERSLPASIGLTERQTDVLALMVQGKPNKLICRELNLAEGTVKIHVTAILKALNVTNRTQAVIKANSLGLRLSPAIKNGSPG